MNRNKISEPLSARLFLNMFVVGSPENIVGGNAVIIREPNQMFERNSLKAPLIAGVDCLAYTEQLGDGSLSEIAVLAQIPKPLKVHKTTSALAFIRTIDFITVRWYTDENSTYKY